jgi:hypothetical protein
MHARRFPPPWSIDELEACFVVQDSTEQKLAYVYFEDEPGRSPALSGLAVSQRYKRYQIVGTRHSYDTDAV